MSHQEYLQETGGQLAHPGRVRSAFAWLVALIVVIGLLHHGAARAAPVPPPAAETDAISSLHVEAARSDWQAQVPPQDGWTAVTLPDIWTQRWPHFDGVVWYRVRWNQTPGSHPAAVALDYLNMAGEIWLNGALLRRDEHLAEPISRMWNTPWYRVLSTRELQPGENTLLVRVSGLSAYQPGLGPLTIGAPGVVWDIYRHARLVRQDLQLFSLAVTATLGCFFLALWSMRPRESAYGWFAILSLTWWCWAVDEIVTTTWPFASNDMWEAADALLFYVFCVSFSIFVLRFCDRRAPRIERVLWLSVAVGVAAVVALPQAQLVTLRIALIPAAASIFFASCFTFLWLAAKSRRTDHRILSVCIVIFIAAGIHDLLTVFSVLRDNHYYTAFTSQFLMVGMAFVLAWHFVANVRRIERFNDELTERIDAARADLATTLQRQHELEVVNARLGERLDLAHDLHDGLGGTLVSSIAMLEHTPESIAPGRVLSILKELRDDLRIIIDTASSRQHGERALDDLIAPLRHRMMRLFEGRDIECAWHVSGLETIGLTASQNLDVLRVLQESLTNVLKHSGATRVRIDLRHLDGSLQLVVEDNGAGFDPAAAEVRRGLGIRSMQTRAARLGGNLTVRSTGGGTVLTLAVEIRPSAVAAECV
ncbi:sensor histidine kinase [Paraburkholderia sp. HP33-1]|uniref:sensor histidine kinase n=1 Tax=Paraburkholderia sp. HP33-1 TaxID=2883243 RepID=UPI001F1CFA42|nr:7TM diverse intracellular signaling domain-containing protein [Paraburkholderia sp. HP33-1]